MTGSHLPSPNRFGHKHKVALAGFSAVVTTLVVVVLLELSGVNVAWQLWYLAASLFGPTRIGIWQEDAVFGWVQTPNSIGRQSKPLSYDVTYHIDAAGNRFTSGSDQAPKILILGDSFTFGQGVEDQSAYPEVLQKRLPDYKVVNAGVSAWNTAQAYLRLQQELAADQQIKAVVYGYIDADLQRNYLRKTWLEHISRSRGLRVPYFDQIGEQLVFKGLADPTTDGLDDGPYLRDKERALTVLLLAAMKSLCGERDIPFIVVHLPDGSPGNPGVDFPAIVGSYSYVDLRRQIDYDKVHLPFDGHLNPAGHQQIAVALEPVLIRWLH